MPVVVSCADGHSYERSAIEDWLRSNTTSPLTNLPLAHNHLTPNYALRSAAEEYRETQSSSDLCAPAAQEELGSRWELAPDQVVVKRDQVIGRGAFGVVVKGFLRENARETPVAIKLISADMDAAAIRKIVDRELKALSIATIKCSKACRLYGTVETAGQLGLVMKHYAGNLRQQLSAAPGNKLPFRQALEVIVQVTTAVAQLHEVHLIHQDLKPSNVLYDQYGQYVVSDFGTSILVEGSLSKFMPTSIAGSCNYMSPEAFDPDEHGGLTSKVDVWSIGCILIEMLTGKAPWEGLKMTAVIKKLVVNSETPEIPTSECTPQLQQAFEAIFTHDAAARPTAAALLDHLLEACPGTCPGKEPVKEGVKEETSENEDRWVQHIAERRALADGDEVGEGACPVCLWPTASCSTGCCSKCHKAVTRLIGAEEASRAQWQAVLTPELVLQTKAQMESFCPAWARENPQLCAAHKVLMDEAATSVAASPSQHRTLIRILQGLSRSQALTSHGLAGMMRELGNPLVTSAQFLEIISTIRSTGHQVDYQFLHVLGQRTADKWNLGSSPQFGIAHCYYGTTWDPDDSSSLFNRDSFFRFVQHDLPHRQAAIYCYMSGGGPVFAESTWTTEDNDFVISRICDTGLAEAAADVLGIPKDSRHRHRLLKAGVLSAKST